MAWKYNSLHVRTPLPRRQEAKRKGTDVELKAGTRMRSTVCETQVVVVRAPQQGVDIECGGAPLVTDMDGAPAGEPASGLDGGTLIGKRYVDEEAGLELLCTKAGTGSLTCNGSVLAVKDAKPLPSSD